ncbi:DEAD/DEAH box helicase [Synechococcus sp. HJ21-Hayes]|uniref:DEAD/DEAH box helicase n=1 Tax=unclassified Synechococcus TaxID=2626047 RepID=UPI0020CEFCA7|nr:MULTISPECIES: DEAD/DEAH box helicase [unclassified Synechococcus]MCP9831523.1 DEAD/DEAH box helicase [Synechococcus sp. JJ3a-Johnson]MCP9853068.1 DEAD/DEAH box helicase [Synechococcus sp. HJ21-Hayes]
MTNTPCESFSYSVDLSAAELPATPTQAEVNTTLIGPIDGIEPTPETGDAPEVDAETDSEAKANGFAAFGFVPELLQALEAIGYSEPSPIQKAAIPELMLGRDLVGQAQTGTGKTAAFALPLLAGLDPDQRTPQVLVLTPTRELAIQVADSFNSYAAKMPHLRVLPIYGGADFRDQIARLKRGVQVVVGTPGRVMDHMRQGTLNLSGLRSLVLDEADEMLRMGFIDDVEWVLGQLPEKRQVVLFSATMPAEIRRISHQYLNDPAEITIKTKGSDSSRIRQRYITVNGPQKLEALSRVLEAETKEGVIIFARTKAITVTVAESLEAKGYDVAVLNGDVAQNQRERTIERLKNGTVDVLVATDVAARGLDVDRITLVVNYDIPFDSEAYVHRIGRTGRAGRTGDAILFITPRERRFLSGLERAVGRPIEPMEIPNNATINQNRLDRLRQQLTAALEPQPADSKGGEAKAEERALLSEILQRVGQEAGVTGEQLALAALQMAVGDQPLLVHGDENWLRQQPSNRDGRVRGERERPALGGRRGPRDESGPPEAHMDRFRIEVGWRDRVKPGNIVGAIANEAGLNGRSIGRIQIFDTHSVVDLPKGMPDEVFQGLRRLRVMNKELQISRV